MPRTRFVADLHLDAARPEILGQFRAFLDATPGDVEALYVLGDLFEHWVGDDAPSDGLELVLDALRRLTRRTPVYVQPGNRDFLLGQGFEARTGCRLLPDAVVMDLYGVSTLLLHGDTLCTDDVRYQRYRRVVRHRLVTGLVRRLPLGLRLRLARGMRRTSHRELARKPSSIMDVNQDAVLQALQRHGVRRLIHGHTHRPGIHRVETAGGPAERFVLGDWYAHGSMLECRPGRCELLQLDPAGLPAGPLSAS